MKAWRQSYRLGASCWCFTLSFRVKSTGFFQRAARWRQAILVASHVVRNYQSNKRSHKITLFLLKRPRTNGKRFWQTISTTSCERRGLKLPVCRSWTTSRSPEPFAVPDAGLHYLLPMQNLTPARGGPAFFNQSHPLRYPSIRISNWYFLGRNAPALSAEAI